MHLENASSNTTESNIIAISFQFRHHDDNLMCLYAVCIETKVHVYEALYVTRTQSTSVSSVIYFLIMFKKEPGSASIILGKMKVFNF